MSTAALLRNALQPRPPRRCSRRGDRLAYYFLAIPSLVRISVTMACFLSSVRSSPRPGTSHPSCTWQWSASRLASSPSSPARRPISFRIIREARRRKGIAHVGPIEIDAGLRNVGTPFRISLAYRLGALTARNRIFFASTRASCSSTEFIAARSFPHDRHVDLTARCSSRRRSW